MRLMGDELIADIILVLKIQIESALCHSGLLHDIGDCRGVDSLCDEEVIGTVEQCFLFLFLIFVNFPHYDQLSFLRR